MKRRRAIILPVVLVLIGLLALTMAGFVFFIRAETAGTAAFGDAQQARLACESGFEYVVALLRVSRDDAGAWFDAPSRFRNMLVWGAQYEFDKDPARQAGGSRSQILQEKGVPPAAWRFSVVAPSADDAPNLRAIRYGLTPEASKLNLNTATETQIEQLFTPLLLDLGIENAAELVAAVLDWRDTDDATRPGGAESEYYNTLKPPYNAKATGKFDTVEELLLVKGFTAAVLYGEDVNRNGLLDPNEDDGDASFPEYDNADGVLNRGLAPYLTVWSREPDTALDNKPRIYLGNAGEVRARIEMYFQAGELSDATINFLTSVSGQVPQMASAADLYPIGVPPGLAGGEAGQPQVPGEQPQGEAGDGPVDEGGKGGESGESGEQKPDESKEKSRAQSRRGEQKKPEPENPEAEGQEQEEPTPQNTTGLQPGMRGEGALTGGRTPGGESGGKSGQGQPQPGPQQPGAGGPPPGGAGGGAGAGVFLPNSPVTLEELPIIMDRFTTRNPQQAAEGIAGLININTASPRVLALIPGITPEAVASIVEARKQLDPNTMKTIAWPVTAGIIDPGIWKAIAPYITTKSYQFKVEVLGYADHAKLMKRMEYQIEMLGSLAQVRYQRDLSALGMAWPVDDDALIQSNR